jgi:hypothetical protein
MKKASILIVGAVATLLASCGQNTTKTETTTVKVQDTLKPVYTRLSLAPTGTSPEFPNAQLMVKNVTAEKAGADSATVTFNFDVKNYELKMQTTDTGTKMCSNSAQGQHIHFIMDNQPYKALYEPTNKITLACNTEHYLMAFLSRSYHESIKSKGAAILYHFKIDEKGNLKKLENPKEPMVFYSRPKGDYLGKDTANVLLDFYIWNCTLAADGYKVQAKITNDTRGAGYDTTLTITDWKSNFIHNLGVGKNHITLTLVDKDGKTVTGPASTATRNITLAVQEPIK